MMEYALSLDGPCAIRYPRGTAPQLDFDSSFEPGRAQQLRNGADAEIWAAGAMVIKALDAAEILEKQGIDAGVVNIASIRPLDCTRLLESGEKYPLIVTLEDNLLAGGIGEEISSVLTNTDVRVLNIGWPGRFIEHGTCEELYRKYSMDADSIAERIVEELEKQA